MKCRVAVYKIDCGKTRNKERALRRLNKKVVLFENGGLLIVEKNIF
jgi:hypothetical protein